MFKVGEIVIHPKIGACQVKEIKEQVILGEKHQCLVLIPLFENHNKLKITLPIENSSKVGLRKPLTTGGVEKIKAFLSQKIDGKEINGQEISLPVLKNKLTSGDPLKIAEVVRDLHAKIKQDGGKYANAQRRSLLKRAKERLIRELSLSMSLSVEEASIEIRSILEG